MRKNSDQPFFPDIEPNIEKDHIQAVRFEPDYISCTGYRCGIKELDVEKVPCRPLPLNPKLTF